MKKYFIAIVLTLSFGFAIWGFGDLRLAESATTSPQIIIAQIKITSSNGQFITLYNNSNSIIDLSTIQLQYFNNYDLLKATTGKLISLSGKVPPHGYAVIDDGPIQACYQMTVNSVSLGLSSTAGFVQVSHFFGTTSPQFISTLDDYVGWSKTSASGAQTLPGSTSAFLQRQAPGGGQDYSKIVIPGAGTWTSVSQPDGSTPCDGSTSAGVAAGGNKLATSSAPVPYSTAVVEAASTFAIPDSDAGLAAPQISEVLPNPAPPVTDADGEFIELYNSNSSQFDLSGFSLQTGTTTFHKYTFPDGTYIAPHQFVAFYSGDTGLSLSNSDGQVKLLEPGGNVLGKTDEYTNAKDGYAWVPVDGLWQWTTTATPNAANIITTPPLAKKSAKTTATSKKKSSNGAVASLSSSNYPPSGTAPANLHPAILAGIGGLAVVYALYEYRHDLANQLYKFRRYREAR
ncbi:MAG TPA: lamin tail domain-containing protein [Candidatus Saccharimonadales bacterium]|nr:lamin tail domain-containing protein [Candidatus Saccharimonadales bacterium]